MAGSSPPNIPDTLNILYFGTLLAAILWSSRHDIRTAVISLAALTVMGLVTPFLGSPDPVFVHVVYLSVATFAFCMSDSHDTASTTSVQGLVSVGTTLASIGKALLVGPVVLLGGVLRLPVTILRVIFSGAMVFGRSVVAVIRGVIYAIRSIAVAAVCVARGAFYITAFSFGMSKRMWTAGSKCIRITGVVTQCIWGLLVAPFAVGKGLVTALVAVLRNALWLVAVTFSFGFRGTVFAARFASKSLILVSHASGIASISIVAVSKRVLLAVRKCTQAKSKPTEHESARVVRVVLCPDDYVFSAPPTDAPVTAPVPASLLRHFDSGILVTLVILSVLRDVLLATASVVDRVPDLVADANLSANLVFIIGPAVIPIALQIAVAGVQDVFTSAKIIFSDMRNTTTRVINELAIATAVVLHYFSFVNVTDMVSAPMTISLASSLQLVPCAVNKKIKCTTLVVRCRPLRFYAISPRWLEALQTRLYMRLIPRSLIATDYFRMIARQFEIPSALASAVSRPGVPAVVKKPLAILALPRLLVRLAKDGGNLASTVVVYDRLEKMLLSTIRVPGIPRSLFASDHFRMVAQQFAAPTVLVPFIGPLVRQLDSPGAHANPISNSRALSVVRTPLAICDIPSLAVEMVQVNDPADSIVVYKANARLEKTIVTRVQVSGIEPSLFATDHFRMIVQQFVILIILASLAGPPRVPEADIALTAFIEEVEDDTIEVVQPPAEIFLDLSDDSSVDMDASTLLDVSLPTDMVEYDVVKSEKASAHLASFATSELSVPVVRLAPDVLRFDLNTTLVESSDFIEAVDDDISKDETTESDLLEASRTIDVVIEDLSPAMMLVVGPVSSPDLPVKGLDSSTEDQLPGSALASLEDEVTVAVVGLDASPLVDLADTDPVQPKEPFMHDLSPAAHVLVDSSVEMDCSGFFDSLLDEVLSTDAAELWPLVEVDAKTQDASADSSLDTLLESIPTVVEITDDNVAHHQDNDDGILQPQQSPALSAYDFSPSDEASHLTLDAQLLDTNATLLGPSRSTAEDAGIEHEQLMDMAVPMINLYAAALELLSETQLAQLVDALMDVAFIDETVQRTVDPSPLPVAVVKANKSSTVTPIDDDDEPIDPPYEVPLPPLLIVSEFIARYVCMVSVCSEIPRIYSLYTFRPIGQEPEEVVLYRTTRVFVAEVQWGEELVREKRRMVFEVSRTSVGVSVQDYRMTSCWSGFTLVARNSLSIDTQRFLKFLRLVYGLTVKRERKRHPRARGGKKVQEAKARKAAKEAARLARIAEEESRVAENATHTAEEDVTPCTEEEETDLVEGVPVSCTAKAEGEVECFATTPGGPADEQLRSTATSTPAPEPYQSESPSRRRHSRRHTSSANNSEVKSGDSSSIPSTVPEEGAGLVRIVESALQGAAGSFGTAPPRAGSRRSRRRILTS